MGNPYITYTTDFISAAANLTPQSRPIPGREMVPNNAGGYAFKLDDWERLNRFLIIGSTGGTYYVGQTKLTEQNADTIIRCIKADGPRVARAAHEVNILNKAPKTDQQLFVLALCLKHGDLETRREVVRVAKDMLRTGTHLLHLTAMIDGLKGWGNLKKRLVASFFTSRGPDELAYQILKYRSRS
jgi:60 kDa SS-A/Ro ribonucleoprotein